MIRKPWEKCRLRLYKKKPQGLQWKQKSAGEANSVVKGTSRRVVVVKSPDPGIFDEAIFIIKDDFLRKNPDGAQKLLQQARQAADDYVRSTAGARPGKGPKATVYALAGAAAAGAAWLAVRFAGVIF